MKKNAPDHLQILASGSEASLSSTEPPRFDPYNCARRPNDTLIAEAIRTRRYALLKWLLDHGANAFAPMPPVTPKGIGAESLFLEQDWIASQVELFDNNPRGDSDSRSLQHVRTSATSEAASSELAVPPSIDTDNSGSLRHFEDSEDLEKHYAPNELHEDVASHILYTSCEALRGFRPDNSAYALRALNDNALAIARGLQHYRRRPVEIKEETDVALFETAGNLNRLFAASFRKENGTRLTHTDQDAAAELKRYSLHILHETLAEADKRPNISLAETEAACRKAIAERRQTNDKQPPFAPVGHAIKGVHALRLALTKGNEKAAVLLASHRNPNSGYNFAHLAAERNEADILDWMLRRFPELLQQPTNLGYTPLMLACQQGSPDSVHVLLKHGADPNLGEQPSLHILPANTPLILAARDAEANSMKDSAHDDALAIVQALIRHKVNVEQVDWLVGASALHYAAEKCSAEMCELLLHEKPEMANATDASGMTPLHYLASGEKEFSMPIDKKVIPAMTMLMKYGANPRAKASGVLVNTNTFTRRSNQFLRQKALPFHGFSLNFRNHLTTEGPLSDLNAAFNPNEQYVRPHYFGSNLPKRSSSFDGFSSAARSFSFPTFPLSKAGVPTLNRTASEPKRPTLFQSKAARPAKSNRSFHPTTLEKASRQHSRAVSRGSSMAHERDARGDPEAAPRDEHAAPLRSRSLYSYLTESIPEDSCRSESDFFRKSYAQSSKKGGVKTPKCMASVARLWSEAGTNVVRYCSGLTRCVSHPAPPPKKQTEQITRAH